MNTVYVKKAGLPFFLFAVMLIVLYFFPACTGSSKIVQKDSTGADGNRFTVFEGTPYICRPDSTCTELQNIGGSVRDTMRIFMYDGSQQSVYMYIPTVFNPKLKSGAGAFKDYLILKKGNKETMYALKYVYKNK